MVEEEFVFVFEVSDYVFVMEDWFFIWFKGEMVKVLFKEILYVEVDRNYCKVFMENESYLLFVLLWNIEV